MIIMKIILLSVRATDWITGFLVLWLALPPMLRAMRNRLTVNGIVEWQDNQYAREINPLAWLCVANLSALHPVVLFTFPVLEQWGLFVGLWPVVHPWAILVGRHILFAINLFWVWRVSSTPKRHLIWCCAVYFFFVGVACLPILHHL